MALLGADRERLGAGVLHGLEDAPQGVCNLLFIATRPEQRQQGHASPPIRHVENKNKARGARIQIVETAGASDIDSARRSYDHLGFERDARGRDDDDAAIDKIIHRKAW